MKRYSLAGLALALLSFVFLSAPAYATAYSYRLQISGLGGGNAASSAGKYWLVTLTPATYLTNSNGEIYTYPTASATLSANCPSGDINLKNGAYSALPTSTATEINPNQWQAGNTDSTLVGKGYSPMTVCIPVTATPGYLGICTIPSGVSSGSELATSNASVSDVAEYTIPNIGWQTIDSCNGTTSSGTGSLSGYCMVNTFNVLPDGDRVYLLTDSNNNISSSPTQPVGESTALVSVNGQVYYLATAHISVESYNSSYLYADDFIDYRYAGPVSAASDAASSATITVHDHDGNAYSEAFNISLPFGIDTSSTGNVASPSAVACP